MRVIFLGFTIFCLLVAEATSIQPTPSNSSQSLEGQKQAANVSVVPTDTPTATNATDKVVPVLQITDYHYFDWPKIGYHIFMRKMIDAVRTLKFFLSLDPMLLKVTKTYILNNSTDLDFIDNNSTDVNGVEVPSLVDQTVETNTQSPLMAEVVGSIKKDSADTKADTSKEESRDNDVKIVKAGENGGVFSSITGAIARFYHALTDWF